MNSSQIYIDEFLVRRQSNSIIDVRSEGEFQNGHIPGAHNIPILNDEERAIVGTIYKQNGQADAIREGLKRVGPRLADIISETERIAQSSEILVHCWRGGMRSANYCQFVGMAKVNSRSLVGGYKTYRQVVLDTFGKSLPLVLIGGCTGSGKSDVLRALAGQGEQILDLEKLASHKGSVFGGLTMPPQPTTEQFQNNLFEAIHSLDATKRIWIEDESLAIGKIFLPEVFWMMMRRSPVVKMEVSKEIRIQRLVAEYGTADRTAFLDAMGKIVKRLGGQHYKAAKEKLLEGDMAATIDILLTYYDKTYTENIDKRKEVIVAELPWDGKVALHYAKALIEVVSEREKVRIG